MSDSYRAGTQSAKMSSFFGGNPFSTPVGQRIEQATDAALASENWALNMEICDLINETEDGPKDALKAVRKRLQQNVGKNYTVVMYTLTVLETCVKNCGKRFHILACSKEFVQELVKLIGPKNDPPTAVQEKVLSLIQSWADAFRTQADMVGVVQVYNDLRQKGIEFPMTDLDTLAPIHTPRRTVPEAAPPPCSPQPMVAPPPATHALLSPEQLAKLRSELDVVRGNMSVLSEMLTELTPGKEHPSDLDLLTELHGTCHAMQQRLVELVDRVASDEVTAELLHLNDELNNLFLRYGRYERNREVSHQASPAKPNADSAAQEETAALIDLGEDIPTAGAQKAAQVASQLSTISLGATQGTNSTPVSNNSKVQSESDDSEFDMFAQSRKVSYEASKKGGSTYMDNTHVDQTNMSLGAAAQARNNAQEEILGMHCESDFDEMEAWLHSKPKDGAKPAPAPESLSSSEFDRFLAERAAAADTPATQTTTHQPRRLDKEEPEGSLFAL